LAIGHAELVSDPTEIARLAKLPLSPWAGGVKPLWVKIRPDSVSGREILRA